MRPWQMLRNDYILDTRIKNLDKNFQDGKKVYIDFRCYLEFSETGYIDQKELEFLDFGRWVDDETARKIIDFCIELKLFEKTDKGMIYSADLLEQRKRYNKWQEDGSEGGKKSAEKKASDYTFKCTDGKRTLSKRTYKEFQSKYPDKKLLDELLTDFQNICEQDEKMRCSKRSLIDHLHVHLLEMYNVPREERQQMKKDGIPF